VLENKSLANISRCFLESSKTIGEVCRQQGQAMIGQLILFAHDRLQQGASAAEVFSHLFAKQRKEVLV
jgi:hypothetical protein